MVVVLVLRCRAISIIRSYTQLIILASSDLISNVFLNFFCIEICPCLSLHVSRLANLSFLIEMERTSKELKKTLVYSGF